MKIDVLGSGSAYSKNSNTSSILVSSQQKQLLIDCGPTIPRALFKREIGVNDIDAIYFTHIHPDHCTGISALLNNWKSFGRTKPLTIFCQKQQQSSLEFLTSFANWPNETLCFEIVWKEISDNFVWQSWEISTAYTQHEIPNRAISIRADGYHLFYSGDGRPTYNTTQLMQNADLAFQECACFTPLEESSSHGDFFACEQLLQLTHVKALGLYHCWDEEINKIAKHVRQADKLFLSHDDLVIDLTQQ